MKDVSQTHVPVMTWQPFPIVQVLNINHKFLSACQGLEVRRDAWRWVSEGSWPNSQVSQDGGNGRARAAQWAGWSVWRGHRRQPQGIPAHASHARYVGQAPRFLIVFRWGATNGRGGGEGCAGVGHEHTQSGRMQAGRQATIRVRASRLNRDRTGDNSETRQYCMICAGSVYFPKETEADWTFEVEEVLTSLSMNPDHSGFRYS